MWRAWVVVSGLVAACGSSSPATHDAPVVLDAPPDSGPPTVAYAGIIHEWMSPTTPGPALAGAMVCLHGTPRCVTTDASGAYTLDQVPASTSVGIAASKTGYLTTLVLLESPATTPPALDVAIVTDAVLQQKLQDAGGTYPLAGTAIVEVGAYAQSGSTVPPAPNATDAMTPVTGHGPVYLGLDGYPDQALTATSAEGGAMFVNVTAGTVDVAITLTGKTCATSQYDGWKGPTAGTIRIPAEADTLTYMSVLCQ